MSFCANFIPSSQCFEIYVSTEYRKILARFFACKNQSKAKLLEMSFLIHKLLKMSFRINKILIRTHTQLVASSKHLNESFNILLTKFNFAFLPTITCQQLSSHSFPSSAWRVNPIFKIIYFIRVIEFFLCDNRKDLYFLPPF